MVETAVTAVSTVAVCDDPPAVAVLAQEAGSVDNLDGALLVPLLVVELLAPALQPRLSQPIHPVAAPADRRAPHAAQVFASLVAEEVCVVVLVLRLYGGVDARLAVRLGDASGQGLEVDGGVALDVVVLHVHPVVLVNRLSSHEEDGSVDDVRVREADFDGVFLVSDPVDLDGDDFVGEDDVSVGMEDHLETEGGRA